MTLKLRDIDFGRAEGKEEFGDFGPDWHQSFLEPNFIDESNLKNRVNYFILGLRGTGKTSYLMWFANNRKLEGGSIRFILFKSNITDATRQLLSSMEGFRVVDGPGGVNSFTQDFKETWKWFIFHNLGEMIKNDEVACDRYTEFLNLLGLGEATLFKKALGVFPSVDNAKIEIEAGVGPLTARIRGDIVEERGKKYTTLLALNKAIEEAFKEIIFNRPVYILFDELEAFYEDESTFHRDLRFIRDLLFNVEHLNRVCREKQSQVYFIASVRDEILNSMGALGQEIQRTARDRSEKMSWYTTKRDGEHPLLLMVSKKIHWSTEKTALKSKEEQVKIFRHWFSENVNNVPVYVYILDRSFYKPRDMVQRLNAIKSADPDALSFTEHGIIKSEAEYSRNMVDELELQLSAQFNNADVTAIKQLFSGQKAFFNFREFRDRFEQKSKYSRNVRELFGKVDVEDLLRILYQMGAVGNEFKLETGRGGINKRKRNRWIFRGDATLLIDKTMVLNRSLWHAFSAVY